jgi:Rod binding domain-containing protein
MQGIDAIGLREHQHGNVQPARLVKAAHEFEAQMMKELLGPMTEEDDSSVSGAAAGSGGILGEFGVEALGRALSEQGGLGIASSIVRSLTHSGNSSSFEPAAVDLAKRTSNI